MASNWHQGAKARTILSRLSADQVSIYPHLPLMGNRCYLWTAGDLDDKLDAIRDAAIEAHYGKFADALDRHAYLDAIEGIPTVQDVLTGLFGHTPNLGSHSTDHANALARQRVIVALSASDREAA